MSGGKSFIKFYYKYKSYKNCRFLIWSDIEVILFFSRYMPIKFGKKTNS